MRDSSPLFSKRCLRILVALTVIAFVNPHALGQVALTGGNVPFYTESDVESYVTKWTTLGGAAIGMISDEFCEMVIMDPDIFLTVMDRHRDVFAEWLKEIPDLSFVDYGGCVDYAAKKRDMIASLRSVKPGRHYDELKKRLLDSLEHLKIRRID